MTRRIIALKRISNDLKSLSKCPLEGIGLEQMSDDPMKFIINMELMTGPYMGYKVQLLMTITDDYPIKPPKILIYPNQEIGSRYHHHIFPAFNGYKKFCIDFLDNDFNMNINEEHTGWNPAYAISSILIQVQNFISDPDMHNPPSKELIESLLKSMDSYERTFIVKENDKEAKIVHTWKNPYPKMYYSNQNKIEMQMEDEEEIVSRNQEEIKENLACYLLKENYIDNQELLLGYPIIKSNSTYGGKVELYPIPQLLTYEAYQMQMGSTQVNQNSLFNSFYTSNSRVKAANNEYFNTWLPIYVDENHYTKNKQTIFNSIRAIKNEVIFKPEQIFDIFPIILNKMIIGMFNGKSRISSAFIICYFQYTLLFKRLCKEFKDEYDTYVNKKISLITMNDYEINKKIIPDIGDFLMLVFLSNKDMSSPEMQKIKTVLTQEFIIREMYWIFHGPECGEAMRKIVVDGSMKVNNDVYLSKFHTDPNFKIRHLGIFNNQLHRLGIYNQVINVISNDKDFLWNYKNNRNYAKRMAHQRITKCFKGLFNEVSSWSRNRLQELIKENMNFSDFFEENEWQIKEELYSSFRVNEILEGNEDSHDLADVLKYAYESQRGNQLLLITFTVLKKLEEQGFMEQLEKDHGVFIGVDKFFEEIRKNLKEIKNFKDLYAFIGTEVGKDMTELELIIDSYGTAKSKKYIRDPNERNLIKSNPYRNSYNYNTTRTRRRWW